MERYSSFKELKEHDRSKRPDPFLLKTTKRDVKIFVELLRNSAQKKIRGN